MCDCRATTIFVNGNNILIASDLVEKTAICRLDAGKLKSEERTFDFNPFERVRANRGAYLAAVFTIARAFRAAGCPKPEGVKTILGYDGWSKWVQQPLMWLGMEDPFAKIEDARAEDPDREELDITITTLKKYHSVLPKEFTVADCKKLAEETHTTSTGPKFAQPDLRDLMLSRGVIDTQAFGNKLRRYRDRWSGGCRLRFVGNTRGRAKYKLEGELDELKGPISPEAKGE
jgi:hypothetical protein